MLFIDTANATNPTPKIGMYESTNPCGESFLLPFEACNLGSLNLTSFLVDEPGKHRHLNIKLLKETIETSIHFLDNVIDMNKFPIHQIEHATKDNRKIGLGIMGWADYLTKMRIPYNSKEAIDFASYLMKNINEVAKEYSFYLSETRGVFPNFYQSIYKDCTPLRNAIVTTIAPTGSISIIAKCSSGIEPLFALAFQRRHDVFDDKVYTEINEQLLNDLFENYGDISNFMISDIKENGSIQHIDDMPDAIKKVYVTAHDISPEWHIKMQAAFQKHTDNAVSKTINFPSSATKEDVAKAFMLAYELGCKGITVYRDGSRDNQVLKTNCIECDDGICSTGDSNE